MPPEFSPGKNIALKVPAHEYAQTVQFYEEVLCLQRVDTGSRDPYDSVTFAFGDKNLWVDRIDGLSQAEVWLEIETDNSAAAKEHLAAHGCVIRDEIEPLPDDFKGFWLSGPSNIIHLVTDKTQ